MRVRQVTPWKTWPSGDSRPIAVLPYDLPELSRRYGLTYEEGIDDLDRYKMAAIELAGGAQAWISKHERDPNPGAVIYVDTAADVDEALSLLADALGIDRDQFSWTAAVSMLVGERR